MNGIIQNNKTITGLSTIQSDIITSDIYYTTDGMNVENAINALSVGLTSTTNNLQDQLNSLITYDTNNTSTINSIQSQINNITSTSTSGGGYFTVVCERIGHFSNQTFGFGAACYTNNNEIVLPACTLTMSRISASQNMTSGTSYYLFYKNGINTTLSTNLTAPNSTATSTHNLTFAEGDTFKIVIANFGTYTTNSTVQLRINLIFECVGVKGADGISPTISIGTTTTLSPGFNASVVNSGTSTNQILNFSIPQGFQGERGLQGLTPLFSIGSVTNLLSGDTPSVSFDATSSDTMKIINFSLVRGQQGIQGNPGNDAITPSFVIGTVSNLASGNVPFVNFDNASSTTNKIMNFGLVQGEKGEKGDSIKGDKGDPGPAASAGDIGNALGTSAVFIVLQGQVTLLQTQMTTVQGQILTIDGTLATHTTEIGNLQTSVGLLETDVDNIQTKLINVVKTPDALQVKSKFQITNNIEAGLMGNIVLATFDPIANIITTGTTNTTNSMIGNIINMGSLSTVTTNILGTTINTGSSTSTSTINILGNIINTGSSTTTTTNIKGATINIGEGQVAGGDIHIEAPNIYMGTEGYFNNVYIGSTFSNVRIESMDNTAIGIGNYLDQFA